MAFAVLIVYVIAMLVRPHEWSILANEEATIVRDSLLICMALFVFHKHKNLSAPHFLAMALLTLSIFLSVAGNGWIGGGIQQSETFVRLALIPFILISGLVDTLRKQYVLFFVIIAASLLMVLNGHTQAINESGIGLAGNSIYAGRITYLGYMSDPNDLGMFFVMSIPLVFLFKDKAPKLLRPLFWFFIGSLVYGVYLTNSRGTLLATLSLLGLWFLRRYGITKSMFLGAGMSPALLVVMSSFRSISASEDSAQGRLDAWATGIELLMGSPLFGVGQGAFTEFHSLTAHNSFVLAFAELGIIGCLSWVALLSTSVLVLINISTRSYLPKDYELSAEQTVVVEKEATIATVMIYSLVGYMVAAFFLSRTYVPVLYLFLGMSSAILGRIRISFPKLETSRFFDTKKTAKYTFAIVFGGIILISALCRAFL